MKQLFSIALLLALLTGCTRSSLESDFQILKKYFGGDSDAATIRADTAEMISTMRHFCFKKNVIPFLWKKAKGKDPADAVTAHIILVNGVEGAQMVPGTVDSQNLIDEINPDRLLEHLEQYDMQQLDGRWLNKHKLVLGRLQGIINE